MKHIIMTGDEQFHLADLHFECLLKNFNIGQEIDFLCFGPVDDIKYSNSNLNIRYVSLGNQKDFLNPKTGYWAWSDAVRPYFKNLKDECFFLTWLEHIPIFQVNALLMGMLYAKVVNGSAHKAICDKHLNIGKFATENILFAKDIIELGQKTLYRTTLMPSIWNKEYFMKFLKPDMTAWDFEINNIENSLCDGATIIAPAIEDAYTIFNFYVKGKFNQGGFDDIKERLREDRRNSILNAIDHSSQSVWHRQRDSNSP